MLTLVARSRSTQVSSMNNSTWDDQQVVAEFARIKIATWRGCRYWLPVLAGGFIGMIAFGDVDDNSSPQRWAFSLVAFCLLCLAILRIVVVVRRTYRCPVCGSIPMNRGSLFGPGSFGIDSSVALNPVTCSSCGARLK